MMDSLTPERRSWNMSRIRGTDTTPERIVRSAVHRLGFRFRLNSGQILFGKPDIVLPKYRAVIFVHGCFWHRHAGCKFAYLPKSRIPFWVKKFDANIRRDITVRRRLHLDGWRIIVIWECQTSDFNKLNSRLSRMLMTLTRRRRSVR
jgi:DNA mismatch endonuclease (patch repair protein)